MIYTLSKKIYPTYYHSYSPGDRAGLYITRKQELSDRPVTALHHHPTFELGFCESGSGKVFIDDRIYDFQAGSVSFVRANQPHYSNSAAGTHAVWYWIYFSPQKIFLSAGLTGFERLCDMCSGGVFGDDAPELITACEKFARTAHSAKGDLLGSLDLAFALGKLFVESARIGGESSPVFRTAAAVRFISNNYGIPELMREEVIARESGFSASYLRALFVRETGMPPRSFISRTRLAAAANLLCETGMKIIEVSEKCGFESLPAFNRKFRKVYGMTPGEYRRSFSGDVSQNSSRHSAFSRE